jgi:protoporphyrinogen oxidase
MRIAVIGAGPAGATAAYQLAKFGFKPDLYEAGTSVGGMAKTLSLWNQRVDLGPHRFFSKDARVNELWLEVVGHDYEMVSRNTRIYYKGRLFQYPLKPFDAFMNLGVLEAARCMISYGAERLKPTEQDGAFESWVISRFGRRLFEIFFKTYSEKLWGISCAELDADFAVQRIRKFSLWEAVKNAMTGGRGNTHKTLVDQFAYPHGGTGTVYERMVKAVTDKGGRVLLGTSVRRLVTERDRVAGLEIEGGRLECYDHVISSMPLTLLVSRLDHAPETLKEATRSLTFRNTILVYLCVDRTDLFPDNWLYIHSPSLKTGRVTNFRNWVPDLYGNDPHTILAFEYWANDDEPLWKEKDEVLVALATRELDETGLAKGAKVLDGKVIRVPRCYPVYARGYKEKLESVQNYLRTVKGLEVIGRYGSFKYNNQDHSILMGLLAAENVAKGESHDLWEVNTDYETYQEQSTITKSGLAGGRVKDEGNRRPLHDLSYRLDLNSSYDGSHSGLNSQKERRKSGL